MKIPALMFFARKKNADDGRYIWLKEHNGKKIKHSITKQQQYKHKNKTQQNITEVLEDTKGLTRSSKSKDRQHNGQKNKDKRTNNDLWNITQKTKDRATQTPLKPGWTQVLWKGQQFLLHMWHMSYYCWTTRTSFDKEIVLDTSMLK